MYRIVLERTATADKLSFVVTPTEDGEGGISAETVIEGDDNFDVAVEKFLANDDMAVGMALALRGLADFFDPHDEEEEDPDAEYGLEDGGEEDDE